MTHFELKKKLGLIFTEAHLKKGGSNKSVNTHPSAKSTGDGTTNSPPFFRKNGVPQWCRAKGRYLTYDEWKQLQNYWETHQLDELKSKGNRK